MRSTQQGQGGLRALAAAVLLAAFETVQGAVTARRRIGAAKRTIIWFRSPGRAHPLAYLNVCELLELDPAAGLQALELILQGMAFEPDAAPAITQAREPLTCSGCSSVLGAHRAAWTFGAGLWIYCGPCRESGAFLPRGEAWRAAARAERDGEPGGPALGA